MIALVDSGADSTVIPLRYLRQIGARKYMDTWMRGVAGQRTLIELYRVSLRFATYEWARLTVAGSTALADVILGRDILNQFIVTLNGLASVVEISQ